MKIKWYKLGKGECPQKPFINDDIEWIWIFINGKTIPARIIENLTKGKYEYMEDDHNSKDSGITHWAEMQFPEEEEYPSKYTK